MSDAYSNSVNSDDENDNKVVEVADNSEHHEEILRYETENDALDATTPENEDQSLSGGGIGPNREKRANSGGDIKPVFTTAWFDDDDEFEQHRKKMQKSMRASVKTDAKLSHMDDRMRLSARTSQRSRIFLGGTEAFDVISNSDMCEYIASLGNEEADVALLEQ